jgi:glycosyltransferase involved in cell wall biosynthesis
MNTESPRRRLHLTVVTETYPPEINGVAHTLEHLVEGLTGRGHQVDLVRPRQPGPGNMTRGPATLVPGLPIPGYRGLRFGLPVYGRLHRLWQGCRPDVCYIATQGPLGFAALRAAKALGVATVTGFHTRFDQYSCHYGLGLLRNPIQRMLRRFHNASDLTLVPTPALREALTAQGFRRVRLFSRGVDTALFSPQRRSTALRQAWGCAAEQLAVLYVGRLASEKNLALAVRAFTAIQSESPEAVFVLVGDGPELTRLQRAHPQFVFTGARTGVDLAAHYASANLFLFPSLTETYGNVVPEAMASGLAVVAFGYAAAATHIRNDLNGVSVQPGDEDAFVRAAAAAAGDRGRLLLLGEQARQTAETLSWDRVLSALEKEMLALVDRRDSLSEEGRRAAASSVE